MGSKKGFTLIELLAVILILGIIALIAIPTVSKLVDNAKMGVFETKVEDTCSMQQLKGTTFTNSYTVSDGEISPSLDIKGDIPNGKIIVDNQCNATYEFIKNSYAGIKDSITGDVNVIKCNGNCTYKYKEAALNGADPVLDKGMIPVAIENDGTVKKADVYSEWYKYDDNDPVNDNSKWANAVLVNNESRSKYQNAAVNTTITLSDITAYLVWIPRYKYAIPTVEDKNNPPLINIVFESKITPKSLGDATGVNYYTHPGFKFGNTELNGIWVAKFETTGTVDAPTSLPNVNSIHNQTISKQFEIAKKYKNYGILYNSHMMKDSEWATVAYLSHSKYGSNNQIRINNYWNDWNTLTGCGAITNDESSSTTCGIVYGNVSSYPQSTTYNISGIYDMNGGSTEIVMGNYKNTIADSGFTQMPESKYFDLYTGDIYETACNGGPCKGYANFETKSWYGDYYYLISSSDPWVARGGKYNWPSISGVFYVDDNSGTTGSSTSFRTSFVDVPQ